jgi:LDH2 family malate/lactate/ureidoglycolate dehydrogenase
MYVRRLLAGTTRARPHIRELHHCGAIAVLDGDAGLGQVVGHAAMRQTIIAAREFGIWPATKGPGWRW